MFFDFSIDLHVIKLKINNETKKNFLKFKKRCIKSDMFLANFGDSF